MQDSGRYIKENKDRLILEYLEKEYIEIAGLENKLANTGAKIKELTDQVNIYLRLKKELTANLDVWRDLNGPKYKKLDY